MKDIVVVLGCYRSGSSILAGLLDRLGVDMGSPYWGDHFEPLDLSQRLREWWSEPTLVEAVDSKVRQAYLEEWFYGRLKHSKVVGCKHPLLALCIPDLREVFGSRIGWVHAYRPFEESLRSLERLQWWNNAHEIQTKLQCQIHSFLEKQAHLRMAYADTLSSPNQQVSRLKEYLNLAPTDYQIASAAGLVRIQRQDERTDTHVHTLRRNPKIVATVLCGNHSAIVGDAIRSIEPWVDEILLINTGIEDNSVSIVSEIARSKLFQFHFPWNGDFAAARNAALDFANLRGATWAITVDTDERMDLTMYKTRTEFLHAMDDERVSAWMVYAKDGSYSKERIIKIPTELRWHGKTHECLDGSTLQERRFLKKVHFWETRKSREEFDLKLDRDIEILKEEIKVNPSNGRAWYYLGQSYELTGKIDEAIEAFTRCEKCKGWYEQITWASFCAARCLALQKRYTEAEERCALALTRTTLFPELPWLLGWCAYQRGEYQLAIHWSQMAAAMGVYRGTSECKVRVSFRYLPAWFEAPYDTMRFACYKLGQSEEECASQLHFEAAVISRKSLYGD